MKGVVNTLFLIRNSSGFGIGDFFIFQMDFNGFIDMEYSGGGES